MSNFNACLWLALQEDIGNYDNFLLVYVIRCWHISHFHNSITLIEIVIEVEGENMKWFKIGRNYYYSIPCHIIGFYQWLIIYCEPCNGVHLSWCMYTCPNPTWMLLHKIGIPMKYHENSRAQYTVYHTLYVDYYMGIVMKCILALWLRAFW